MIEVVWQERRYAVFERDLLERGPHEEVRGRGPAADWALWHVVWQKTRGTGILTQDLPPRCHSPQGLEQILQPDGLSRARLRFLTGKGE